MNITVLSIGKIRNKNVLLEIEELKKRMPKVKFIETKDFKDKNISVIQRKELDEIKKYLKPSNYNILLSEFGKEFSTSEFYNYFKKQEKPLFFIISGPFGHDRILEKEVDLVLSLSKMTYAHEVAKLLLIDQIYRYYCFEKNINYTK